MTLTSIRKRKIKAALILQRKLNAIYEEAYIILKRRRERRWAVRPINKNRDSHGFFNVMFDDLLRDEDAFKNYFR